MRVTHFVDHRHAAPLCGAVEHSNWIATSQFALSDEFLFEAGSRDDLTRKIDRWIEDPAALARARTGYRQASVRYAVEASAERLMAVYRQVARPARGGGAGPTGAGS